MSALSTPVRWWLAALYASHWLCSGALAEPTTVGPAGSLTASDEDFAHARARSFSADAMAAYRAGEFGRALVRFQDAYDQVPAPELLFNIGQCYRQLNRREAAKAVFAAYLKALPEAPERAQIERWVAASDRQHTLAPTAATLPSPRPPARATPARDRALTARPASAREHDDASLPEQWWFWTALGVVAVGGGVTAALLLADDDGGEAPAAGTLGTVRWN